LYRRNDFPHNLRRRTTRWRAGWIDFYSDDVLRSNEFGPGLARGLLACQLSHRLIEHLANHRLTDTVPDNRAFVRNFDHATRI
jgi:hypothetical protein